MTGALIATLGVVFLEKLKPGYASTAHYKEIKK
jgi:hypothetical protein